ncbi:MAG: hypothetical protein R6X34_26375 [Chloroflexota bacterium]
MRKKEKATITDSGYDCDHCGGEIYISQEKGTGRPVEGYYVCRRCGCAWTLKGAVLQIGADRECQNAQKKRITEGTMTLPELSEMSGWKRLLLIVGGVILFLVLLRFGGLMLFRFLLPLIVLGILGYLIYKFGREQRWW